MVAPFASLIALRIEPERAKLLDGFFVSSSDFEVVTATGTIQSNAAPLSADKYWHAVANTGGGVGVILPSVSKVGTLKFIQNTPTNNISLKIYPASGGTINGGAADAALTTATGQSTLTARCTGTNQWSIA